MEIVGCDFHPGWQQVAIFDSDTGEIEQRKLANGDGEAERFYRGLPAPALVCVALTCPRKTLPVVAGVLS
jgi:transposase